MTDIWSDDRLGYREIGISFTKLIKSIDDSKVISVEAGFGRGKTFFRKAWAIHLADEGEVVVEIDVQQSDHSGDPLITLLGALADKLPKKKKSKGETALATAKKFGAIGARTVVKAAFRAGSEELIDALSTKAVDTLDGFDSLNSAIAEIGNEMSKAAEQLILAQMAAEKVRKEELPEQLSSLRKELTKNHKNSRIVIIIDELDRCHPEYAISFLESIKLIFNQDGFVFCLMINENYLESIAQNRFGASSNDEKYLDKFVDIRLRLKAKPEKIRDAIYNLALELPAINLYASTPEFSLEHAATLAGELAIQSELSMRKIKRILLKVEVALRCYSDRPLDTSLLVFLAFQDEVGKKINQKTLSRSFLTPQEGEKAESQYDSWNGNPYAGSRSFGGTLMNDITTHAPELQYLPSERYRTPDERNRPMWEKIYFYFAKHYLPEHREVLDAVAAIVPVQD